MHNDVGSNPVQGVKYFYQAAQKIKPSKNVITMLFMPSLMDILSN